MERGGIALAEAARKEFDSTRRISELGQKIIVLESRLCRKEDCKQCEPLKTKISIYNREREELNSFSPPLLIITGFKWLSGALLAASVLSAAASKSKS